MDTTAELIALKQEVAKLKEQLAELRSFLSVQESEVPNQKVLTIRCSGVFLYNPEQPDQLQGMLTAAQDGPSLTLWGSDSKGRVAVEVEEDRGVVRLFQKDLKTGVELGETKNGEPYVAAFHEGRPRAQLKGTNERGFVAAIHDDGQGRVLMSSQLGHGDLLVVGGDMRAAVKLSSEGKDGGGFLTVNHANGKAAVILTSTPGSGVAILNDSRGNLVDSLPSVKPGSDETE
jgi:hypothetical protein